MSDYKQFEKNSPAYIENLWAEYKKVKGYDQGGDVQPVDKSFLSDLSDKIRAATSAPPKPSPSPTPLEDKYQKIRDQNRKNVDDPVNNPSANYSNGGKVQKVEGADVPVNASQLESEYAPEEDAAQEAATDSTQGQVEQASQEPQEQTPEEQAESAAMASTVPGEAQVVIDQPQKDVRQLPADTLTADEALSDREPASEDDGKSAAELAQPLLEKADQSTQSGILQQLLQAQQQRKNELQSEQAQKFGNLIGAGIAGARGQKVNPLPANYFQNPALANLPVQNLEEQLQVSKLDPNSDYSKAVQKMAVDRLGLKPETVAGVPAAILEKSLPQSLMLPLKNQFAMQQIASKGEQQRLTQTGTTDATPGGTIGLKGGQSRQTEDEKQKGRMQLEWQKEAGRQALNDQKVTKQLSQMGIQADKDMDSKVLGSRNALGIASRTALFADKLPALAAQYQNLNDVPPVIATDINQAFGNLISQGVPGQIMMQKLDSANLPKTAAGFYQYLTANPTGAGQKELLDVILKSAKTQKEVAQAQINEYVIPTLKIREQAGLPKEAKSLLLNKYGISDDDYNNWQKGNQISKVVQNVSPSDQAQPQRLPASIGAPQPAGTPPPANEEKRQTKDGRIAIFDKTTKQFLRYEQ